MNTISEYADKVNLSRQRVWTMINKIKKLESLEQTEITKKRLERMMNRFPDVESFEKVGSTWIINLKSS